MTAFTRALIVILLPFQLALGDEALPGHLGEARIVRKVMNESGGIDHEIGVCFVPENRNSKNSRTIGVGFARYPTTASQSGPPIFILPGGPASSYVEKNDHPAKAIRMLSQDMPDYFKQLRQVADVICVDQRGFSKRGDVLTVSFEVAAPPKTTPLSVSRYESAIGTAIKDTVRDYSKEGVDLRGYTIIEMAADVEDLRKALGYERIVLMGGSFGTTWSLAVMRLYPVSVDRALLSATSPIGNTYDDPTLVLAALRRMWKWVDQQDSWKPFLPEGGMQEAADVVLKRLEKGIPVQRRGLFGIGHPALVRTLGPEDFPFSDPGQILELYHGHTERWAEPIKTSIHTYSVMGECVNSSNGCSISRLDRIVNDSAAKYIRSRAAHESRVRSTAAYWPAKDIGRFRRQTRCDIPVVFVHGNWDLLTPIEYLHELTPSFSNHHSIIFHRGGHLGVGTVLVATQQLRASVLKFLKSGDMDGLPTKLLVAPDLEPPTFNIPTKPLVTATQE